MQSKDTEIQVLFWRCLNVVMSRNDVDHPKFKGFMANSVMANWNAVRIDCSNGSSNEKMENCERTYLLYWTTFLQKHTLITLNKHFNINTTQCASNTKILRLWRKQRYVTLQFSHGDYHLGVQVKKHFIT